MYDVLESKGVKSIDELKEKNPDAVKEEIISPNIEKGIQAADNLDVDLPSLAPSVFEGKKFRWNQEEYMSLWLKVIEERAREMYMTEGWEYSNGGVAEFTRAMEMKYKFVTLKERGRFDNLDSEIVENMEKDMSQMNVFDINKKEISLSDGCEKVVSAISDLDRRGFDYSSLQNLLKPLRDVLGFFNAHDTSLWEWEYAMGKNSRNPKEIEMVNFREY